MTPAPASRLDALTSLRFVAAMMIVLFHTQDGFGRTPSALNLAQGVSFFYVRSGFILTLVYPRLESWPAVRRFWRARFARVWPAYMVALAVGFWLLGYPFHPATFAAYVAMVQSWIPVPAFYFGYNAVGWSVATEWFFYLCFPLLVAGFARTWKWKLAGTATLVVALAALCTVLDWPVNGRAWVPEEAWVPSEVGVMYIHPVARLFEFVCGMCVALAWRSRDASRSPSVVAATALELAALAACVLALWLSPGIQAWVLVNLGDPASSWMDAGGSTGVFAALVYVMALGQGAVSRALSWRPFVVLGEISFSIYLLHQLVYFAYTARIHDLPAVPDAVAFAAYIAFVLLASYVVWSCVEMPTRRLIVGAPLHGSSVVTEATRTERIGAWLRPAGAFAAFAVVLLALDAVTTDPTPLARMAGTPESRPSPGSCNIETVNEVRLAAAEPLPIGGGTVRLQGWFLSEISGQPGLPASLRLLADSADAGWVAPIVHWTPRPDVLEKMQATGNGLPGFAQRFDVSGLDPGTYNLALVFEDGGRTYACNTRRQVVLGGG